MPVKIGNIGLVNCLFFLPGNYICIWPDCHFRHVGCCWDKERAGELDRGALQDVAQMTKGNMQFSAVVL